MMMAVSLYQFHSRSSHDLSKELLKVDNKGIYFDETSSEHSDGSRRASVESITKYDSSKSDNWLIKPHLLRENYVARFARLYELPRDKALKKWNTMEIDGMMTIRWELTSPLIATKPAIPLSFFICWCYDGGPTTLHWDCTELTLWINDVKHVQTWIFRKLLNQV